MNSRKFSLRQLLGSLFKKRSSAVALTSQKAQSTSARERVRSGIEPLEGRIAPAVLLNGHTLSYTDSDGDAVKVVFSRDIFDLSSASLSASLSNVFKFSAGRAHTGATNPADDVPQQLQLIDLSQVPSLIVNGTLTSRVAGVSLTVTSETNVGGALPPGDGFAAVGAIKAGGNGLGTVSIDGDLGQIDAGSGSARVGVNILIAQSIGKFGTATQVTTPVPDLTSTINGLLGRLIVFEDVKGYVHVVDSTRLVNGVTTITQRGGIGQINIRGSLIGDSTLGEASDNTGRIDASYDIGNVLIGTDATNGIFGGGGKNSGAINAAHTLASLTVSGPIEGGGAEGSGVVSSGGAFGTVKIGGDLKGGVGLNSGSVRSGGAMRDVTIGSDAAPHDLIGAAGESSGSLVSGSALGNVHIFGNITGAGLRSGSVSAGGSIASVVVEGNFSGGSGLASGIIDAATNLGAVLVRGDVNGGGGAESGIISAGSTLTRITVLGDVNGGEGAHSGAIFGGHDPLAAVKTLSNVTVGGALVGGGGISSGALVSGGSIGTVRVGSSLTTGFAIAGGVGALSGNIFAEGGIASITVSRGVQGGAGAGSASIQATGLLGGVLINGDLAGGSGRESGSIFSHENSAFPRPIAGDIGAINITGALTGAGDRSGLIEADGALGRALVGSMQGGAGSFSGAIVSGAGFVRPGGTALVTVAGSLQGGTGDHSGSVQIGGRLASFTAGSLNLASVRAADDIGSLRINGEVLNSIITARGQLVHPALADTAIGSITVAGNVTNSSIRAGYDVLGTAVNADAQIGSVRVGGNWTGSVLAAGVDDGDDNLFGTADDRLIPVANSARIVSQIASVVINGNVAGTAGAGDHFGFISQRIGSFSANGVALALTAAGGQAFEVGATGDATVREVVLV